MGKSLKIVPWDVTEFLETEQDMAAYLDAAIEDGHPAVIELALANIARARKARHGKP
jgi:probable addiction module antidote protein